MDDSFLGNEATATILSGVRSIAAKAKSLDFAVSYVQVSGWNLLSEIRPQLDLRLLLTDQFELTHPNALQLARNSGVQLRRYVGNRIYHPKVYLGRNPDGSPSGAVIGSGNLSASGMAAGVEAAIIVRNPQLLNAIGLWFHELWANVGSAGDVDQGVIDRYRDRWRIAARARVKMRRERRRRAGAVSELAGGPEDIEVLEDLCETIRVPIALLSMDQARNNVRNLSK